MTSAKRRKQRLTKRARLLSTEDLMTVVARRESERTVRENASRANDASDELIASERSGNEEGPPDAAEASEAAGPVLQDAEHASTE